MKKDNIAIVQVDEDSKQLIAAIQDEINQEVAAVMNGAPCRTELKRLSGMCEDISENLHTIAPKLQKLSSHLENYSYSDEIGRLSLGFKDFSEELSLDISKIRQEQVHSVATISKAIDDYSDSQTNILFQCLDEHAQLIQQALELLSQIQQAVSGLEKTVLQEYREETEIHQQIMNEMLERMHTEVDEKLQIILDELAYQRLPFYKKWFGRTKK